MKQFVMIATKATREIEVIKDADSCAPLRSLAVDYYDVWKDLHRCNLATSGVSFMVLESKNLQKLKENRRFDDIIMYQVGGF